MPKTACEFVTKLNGVMKNVDLLVRNYTARIASYANLGTVEKLG